MLNTFCIVGTDQECARQLLALRVKYRVTDLVGVCGIGGMDPARCEQAMRLAMEKVIPYV